MLHILGNVEQAPVYGLILIGRTVITQIIGAHIGRIGIILITILVGTIGTIHIGTIGHHIQTTGMTPIGIIGMILIALIVYRVALHKILATVLPVLVATAKHIEKKKA